MTLSDPRIAEIRAQLAAISPKPWCRDLSKGPVFVYCDDSLGSAVAQTRLAYTMAITNEQADRNAEFIASAPSSMEYLLGELERFQDRELRLDEDGNGLMCAQSICPHGAPTAGHCVPCMDRMLTHTFIDMRDLARERDEARGELDALRAQLDALKEGR